MQIRIADLAEDSIVDGPGIRLTVFAQGCTHNCKGCHNPSTHNIKGGKLIEVDDIIKKLENNILLDGITLSGGEPFLQPKEMSELVEKTKKMGLSVVAYTGFVWEKLIEEKDKYFGLLKNIDILIDGPFVEELKSYDLLFRGSSNQRIIDVKKSFLENKVVEYNF